MRSFGKLRYGFLDTIPCGCGGFMIISHRFLTVSIMRRSRYIIAIIALLSAAMLSGCSDAGKESAAGEDAEDNGSTEDIGEDMAREEGLSAGDAVLLDIARKAVIAVVERDEVYEPEKPESAELNENSGVFVTLKYKGGLRGCIGYVEPIKPLYIGVRDNAINAAVKDHRFLPVKESELEDIEIEISVMTPLAEVENIEDIEVGRDGLYIEGMGRGGLLLPQVAPEQGWDRDQFLDGVCGKAGLPAGAYNEPGVKLYSFSAHIFGGPLYPKEPT
jgi:AmmeMemoRadiSam system protein A